VGLDGVMADTVSAPVCVTVAGGDGLKLWEADGVRGDREAVPVPVEGVQLRDAEGEPLWLRQVGVAVALRREPLRVKVTVGRRVAERDDEAVLRVPDSDLDTEPPVQDRVWVGLCVYERVTVLVWEYLMEGTSVCE